MSLLKQKYRDERRLVSTYMARKRLPPEVVAMTCRIRSWFLNNSE
jgi:hypothetical protein